MHNGGMVAIQIRDVPDDARDALTERARARGQSLQAFLREIVLREAAFGHNVAVLDTIATWRAGSPASGQDVLDALDDARTRRPGDAT